MRIVSCKEKNSKRLSNFGTMYPAAKSLEHIENMCIIMRVYVRRNSFPPGLIVTCLLSLHHKQNTGRFCFNKENKKSVIPKSTRDEDIGECHNKKRGNKWNFIYWIILSKPLSLAQIADQLQEFLWLYGNRKISIKKLCKKEKDRTSWN